jgi:signal transduction histidine kinase
MPASRDDSNDALIRQTTRALKALSLCGKALVQSSEESDLLARICQIIVNVAGYRLAWVGLAESDAQKSVRPVAQAGFEEGYLDMVKITWADSERGQGPTGTSIRTGRLTVLRDMRTSPSFAPWREEALRRGYASSVGLPLIADATTFGAITIYAPESDAFDQEELNLLRELADNVAYGIMSLRTRAAQKKAEELLQRSHDELETRVEQRTRELAASNEQLRLQIAQRIVAEEAIQRERHTLRQLLDAYEKHRQLIAYEIHDAVAQPLAGALMSLEVVLLQLPHDCPSAARGELDRVGRLLRVGIQEARQLMGGLRPLVLDEAGLLMAIEDLVCQAASEKGVQIDWSANVKFSRLTPPLETAVFRIVQEGLTNALRHSRSETIRLLLHQQDSRLRIEVEDRGVGFDPQQRPQGRFGLQGILERARLFGGSATIDSHPGRGTRIDVELPIVEANTEKF